uniref:ARAD1A07458p n=1 Tax=Blastobotrys adeninivorans TaxID=409370 RepID=A0A060SWR9_BLAAD
MQWVHLAQLSVLLAGASGQQIFNTVNSSVTSRKFTPTYKQSSFAYTQSTTVRYASSVPNPTTTSLYADSYEELKHLISEVSTTTWGNWDPSGPKATDTGDKYGQAAFSGLWESASLVNFTRGRYSSTVSPTAIPTSELVVPPSDPFSFRDDLSFPSDFIMGVAGSAVQIEGAVADEGRGPTYQEVEYPVEDFVTDENYYLYKQDIARLAAMGAKYYSFSISWTRILPFAVPGSPVNQKGIDHYNDLINTILDYGMIPIATLHHFDTPLVISQNATSKYDYTYTNAGLSNHSFVDAFVNYGKIALAHFADRVPMWVSINEPNMGAANAQGVKNALLGHSKLYHFYHDEIKGRGQFGIKFTLSFGIPLDPLNSTHVEYAERYNHFHIEHFARPIFLGQDYPQDYSEMWKDTDLDYKLSDDDLKLIANTSDFLGVDPYTVTVVSPSDQGGKACMANVSNPLWPYCANQISEDIHGWAIGYRSQNYVYTTPSYVRSALNYLWNSFKKPVLVSEFGFAEWMEEEKEWKDQLFDSSRSAYIRSYLNAMLEAIHYDNVHVMGALVWSYADNWEFGDYGAQMGMQMVNRTTQERRYKKSFFDFVDFVEQRRSQ